MTDETMTPVEEANNIIIFPKQPVRDVTKLNDPTRLNDEYISARKKKTADGMVNNYCEQIAKLMGMNGIDISTERFLKDFIIMNEIMKSVIYRAVGLPHPFQKFMDDITKSMIKTIVNDAHVRKFILSAEKLQEELNRMGDLNSIIDSLSIASITSDDDDPEPPEAA